MYRVVFLTSILLFAANSNAPYKLSSSEEVLFRDIFYKISQEINTDYSFKFELIRSYVTELIYQAIKLRSLTELHHPADAKSRITALFRNLLEKQFPISSIDQQFHSSAIQFAEQLNIHVDHLNRAVRAITGKTTTALIMERVLTEAKALLAHTDWNVADIGFCLGFQEIANFNHFFKKYTAITPSDYRRQVV